MAREALLAHSPANYRRGNCGEFWRTQLQQKFIIELTVDFQDPGKFNSLVVVCRQAAQQLHANAALLADGQKPQVSIIGDNYYEGTKEIMLFEGKIEDGLAMIGPATEADQVSEEMLDAIRAHQQKGAE